MNKNSWGYIQEILTFGIGLFMWVLFIIGDFVFNFNVGFFFTSGLFFIMFYMIAKIWWAIQFDGALSVFTKKNR
jgi:hypothetical protein